MSRLTQLDDVLFPVQEHPVFVSVNGASGEHLLPVPDKKAIVATADRRVLGIVSRGYRLVTNREALNWAFQCCRAVFPENTASEWDVKTTDAPATGGHCFIDLVHNSAALDFSLVSPQGRPDAFGPFIRVTNSYNGLRALSFDIGFYRKVCTNGLILRDAIIRFKFNHLRRDIGEDIQFEVAHDRLAKLNISFGYYLTALRDTPIPRGAFEPFVRGVLSLRPSERLSANTREANEWTTLSTPETILWPSRRATTAWPASW